MGGTRERGVDCSASYEARKFGVHPAKPMASAYEDICRERCLSLMKEGVMVFTTLGRWWDRKEEVDIVALDEAQGVAWFGQCKWSRKKVGTDIYESFLRKARLVPKKPLLKGPASPLKLLSQSTFIGISSFSPSVSYLFNNFSTSALISSLKDSGSRTLAFDPQLMIQNLISSVPATSASKMMEQAAGRDDPVMG